MPSLEKLYYDPKTGFRGRDHFVKIAVASGHTKKSAKEYYYRQATSQLYSAPAYSNIPYSGGRYRLMADLLMQRTTRPYPTG